MITDYSTIKYRTAEDIKSSIQNFDDAKRLRRALSEVRKGFPNQKTKISIIERRIRQLIGCRFKGCKEKATTTHCSHCKQPVCKKHKGPGNHGGIPGGDTA